MNGAKVNCEWFLSELEGLPSADGHGTTSADVLRQLPDEAKAHAVNCAECRAALEDFAETRAAFAGMADAPMEAGPWFTRRVMRAIETQELELEERQTGFWNGVRRLAPRLVAFATLLLMLGGTWAFQVRRSTQSTKPRMTAFEGVFEAAPNIPVNDDIVLGAHEERLP
jgi:hypothetical protein